MTRTIDELEDELNTLEELRSQYARDLEEAQTDPNYDEEFREQDIETASEELRQINMKIAKIKKQLEGSW